MLFGLFDPAVAWYEPEGMPLADRNPYRSAQAVGEGVLGRVMAAIDDFSAVPTTFIDGGDYVVVQGRFGGTMKKSGQKLDAPFCHIHRLSGGKVVTFKGYTDTRQWTQLMS